MSSHRPGSQEPGASRDPEGGAASAYEHLYRPSRGDQEPSTAQYPHAQRGPQSQQQWSDQQWSRQEPGSQQSATQHFSQHQDQRSLTGFDAVGLGQPAPHPDHRGGYQHPPQQNQQRSGVGTGVLFGLLIALVVMGLVGGILWASGILSPTKPAAVPAPAATAEPAPASPSSAPQASTPAAQPTPAQQPSTSPAPVDFPAGAMVCPTTGGSYTHANESAVGNSMTTCKFAEAVRVAYGRTGASGGPVTVRATSPVTGSTYTMSCTGDQLVTCTGGNDAVVLLR